jgi:hypothetical protein
MCLVPTGFESHRLPSCDAATSFCPGDEVIANNERADREAEKRPRLLVELLPVGYKLGWFQERLVVGGIPAICHHSPR